MHFSGKEQGNSSTQGSGAECAPCSMIHKYEVTRNIILTFILKYIEKTSTTFILQKYQQLVEGHWGVWNKTVVSTKLKKNRVFIYLDS